MTACASRLALCPGAVQGSRSTLCALCTLCTLCGRRYWKELSQEAPTKSGPPAVTVTVVSESTGISGKQAGTQAC